MKKIPFLQIVLFILTMLSTLFVGAMQTGADILKDPWKIYYGLPFALTLMIILLTHELSHYFASKKHGVNATLPYFIPAPTIIGTFGAFIKMKSPIVTRKALIDIGASGPIAGFIVSVIAVMIGLHLSKIVPVVETKGALTLGDSILFSFLAQTVLGVTPADSDILLNPVAFAGWIGLFVTSMNLIPVGQLDGGHIAFAFLGEKQTRLSFILVLVMSLLGVLLWEGWIIWAVLLLVLGLRHPPVISWEVPLDNRRKVIGWLTFVIFILTFIPVPFRIL
ncbi:MAG TPA: site-2 protease family protein [Thermodesulfovibrionales bacterium]|jgi:membrane-associated protease RseP (regulator of RpoE activity)|nr:site-2 protease family protein [Thermodesulfovibrionales bacterium]